MSPPSVAGQYPVKFAKIDNSAASGDVAIVAPVPDHRIRVLAFWFVATLDTVVTFRSGTTALTGPAAIAAKGGVSADSATGLFQTIDETHPLNINSSVATAVGGSLAYTLIPGQRGGGGDLL